MKKTNVIILSALILVLTFFNAFAMSSSNRIYADAVTVEGGETITIPVKIENNEGFMGFAVYVTYDSVAFKPNSVSKDSILSGMFNDSIATSVDNSFKVVFTGTSNIADDGILFNLKFDISDGVSGRYEIGLSYSRQDTFNENWDDVAFSCENIEVIVTENGTTAPETVITTVAPTLPVTEPSTTQPSLTEPSTVTVSEPATESTTVPTATTTVKCETTTLSSIATTTVKHEATTIPEDVPSTEPVTEPSTEPLTEPDVEKLLSVRMKEWVKALPAPFNILLGIFVYPLAFIISIFE